MENKISSPKGHILIRNENNMALLFSREMLTLSTSQLNGGMSKNLKSIFNHQLTDWIESVDQLPEKSVTSFLAGKARDLGLVAVESSGLMTTASMKNASVKFYEDQDFSFILVISGGAGVNALRSGDPPTYRETGPNDFQALGGTINIILLLEFALPPEALARLAIIITEAKTAALLDLGIKSSVSLEPATGTGTDGFILTCHQEDDKVFTDVGNHSFLGSTISSYIKEGVASTLIKEKNDYIERERKKNHANNEGK